MTAGIAVTGDLRKSRAPGGLDRTAALDGGGVKEKKIVIGAGTLRAEDPEQPLDGCGKTHPAFMKRVLSRKIREEMPDLPAGGPKEAAVRWDTHEDLGHGEGNDLGITGLAPGVSLPLWQKIIGCAINDSAEGVEVGVHRGLRADGVLDTADFDPSASKPFFSAMFVASTI